MPSLAALFAHWLRLPPVVPAAAAPLPEPAAQPAYPRAASGLPAIALAELLAAHGDWLRRLRDAYGAESAVFDRDIGSVVERYAQYVHLLPATPDGPYGEAGGLLRAGLAIGFYALQASDGALFGGRQTITVRASLAPRWRYATFLAGLCSELHRTLNHLRVHNDQGVAWPAYRQPLALWLEQTHSPRYHACWTPNPAPVRALGLVAMAQVAGPEIMQYLAQGNRVIVPHLVAALSASVLAGDANTLERLVWRASALVLEGEAPRDSAQLDARPPHARRALPAGEPPDAAQPPPCPARAAQPLTLVAPAHLHPAVREALRQIIASLDSTTQPLPARVLADGVFVPLPEFTRRQVDPALAVRALSDAHMLACAPGEGKPRTCRLEVDQEAVLGVVLASACVSGFAARVATAASAA
jgi:hypothetical protein